ncbi:MAG: rhodanese-like domain-containing protein [Thermoleophilaceae bacterium]
MADEETFELSPGEAAELIESGAELVDVRTPEEYEAGHIEGSRHIPLETLTAEAETLPDGKPVVFVCRVGNRSGMAAAAMQASGRDARNLAGGLVAWAEDERALEPADGEVIEHSTLPPG